VKDVFSWRRSTDFEHVKAEVKGVRDSVGLAEISGFSKFSVKGPGARAWLDKVLACKIPNPGRMTLAPMLKRDGKLIGDLSLACLAEDDYFLAGSGMAEIYYMRWWEQHLPADGSVRVEANGLGMTGLTIAGPNARKVLEKLTHTDVSNEAFRFMAIRKMELGFAPCLVGRVSFTGDLGYEIWMKPEYQRHVFDRLMAAGAEFNIRLFGLRALNSMRLEKNFGGWAREYRPLYGPLEAGLDRFIAYEKPADFIGKAAAVKERETGGKYRLRAFTVQAKDADVIGDEPIWLDGEVVGWVTSGGYAHNSSASMAMGYVYKQHANAEGPWSIELLGERLPARVQHAPIWDANAERMRG
jgi:dimethylglycine dehydrogenase